MRRLKVDDAHFPIFNMFAEKSEFGKFRSTVRPKVSCPARIDDEIVFLNTVLEVVT